MQFDKQTTRVLDQCYLGDDTTRRRRFSLEKLNPGPADTILDLGCGNGLLTAELARAVGEGGRIIGVDPSKDMRDAAVARNREFSWVEFKEGQATDLPLDNDSVDKAVSLQVFEYIEDLPKALNELQRVLHADGKLVIGDHHWDSWVWHSEDPERMSRVMKAWDDHLVERCIPAKISPLLRKAGFVVDNIYPVTCSDYKLKPDGLANLFLKLIEPYILARKLVPEAEVIAWREEQLALARAGQFFHSLTHFVIVARKS